MTIGSVSPLTVDAGDAAGILRLLPSRPSRILLIGPRFEALAGALSAHGHVLTQVPSVSLESFQARPDTDNGSMQAIIVGELAQEIDALTLFSVSYDALSMGGVLILLAPAARHAAIAARRGVAPTDYLTMVAERHGFSVVSERVDSGVYVYTKSATPRWRVKRAWGGDVAPVLALFREVFGHPMSIAHREWKYGERRGFGVIAHSAGKIVAHFGGILRRVLVSGKPCDAFQICDVLVEPKERAVLTLSGPFFLTAVSFAESGKAAGALLGYGFPNTRHMRLAEKLEIYQDVGGLVEIRWQSLPDRPRLWTRARHLTPASADTDNIIDRLWREMAQDLRSAVVGERDARYVRHRYFNHPDKHYDVVLITNRLTSAARGILVLRRDEGRGELLDVIAPLKNLPMLVDHARRLLSLWGLREMVGWITQHNAALFTAIGGTEHPLEIRTPTCIWVDGPELDELRDKWWLMGGDTDFR